RYALEDTLPKLAVFDSKLRDFVSFQSEVMTDAAKIAAANYVSGRRFLITLSILALLLGVGSAWWITRSIVGPVSKAVEAVGQISQGDLTVKLEHKSADEI